VALISNRLGPILTPKRVKQKHFFGPSYLERKLSKKTIFQNWIVGGIKGGISAKRGLVWYN
jgi:hypothetical protein